MTPTTDHPIVEAPAAPEIAGYKIHPAANLIPEPSHADYERLKADIKEHGLRELIVLTCDDQDQDQILDGRTRARILNELGIEIMTVPLMEKGRWISGATARYLEAGEDDDPIAYVLSANAARRHLTGDQIIALYLQANAPKLEADKLAAKATQQANLKKGAAQPEKLTVILSGETAASKIATAVGKSLAAVKRVQRVQKVAPERLADVAAGKLSAAKVLKESKPPANKSDLWEGIIRYETPKERRDVVKWLDKAFEFLSTWTVKPPAGFDSFGSALAAIEMGAMCLTPAHIKALTGWHDRIAAILQKAEVKPEPASVPAWAEEVAP